MADDDTIQERLSTAQVRASQLKADLARIAGEIATTELRAADVLEGAAEAHPDRRDHLRDLADEAKRFAVEEREASLDQ